MAQTTPDVWAHCCHCVHRQVLRFDVYIYFVDLPTEKPRPDGLALAFQK